MSSLSAFTPTPRRADVSSHPEGGTDPDVTTVLAGGRYELGPVLGTGGMASVRSATDTVLGRAVAVKVFRDDLDEDSAIRARNEMQTLASLSHPHLVAVHDAGTFDEGHPYLVMELVEGPTLAACCSDGSLSQKQLVRIGAELADALAYVHGRGVIHRDVKPANILISPTGVKLADFGIARIVDSARHTGTGLTVGTAPYLAPEQVTGGAVGPEADIYALGLVLLECLTGRREYTGSAVETAMARLHRQPEIPDSLPVPWPSLLHAMTARDPALRPTAAEVAEALTMGVLPTTTQTRLSLQQADPLPPTRVQRVVAESTGSPHQQRGRWVAAAVAAAAVVVLAVIMSSSGLPVHAPAPSTPLEKHISQLEDAVR